MRRVTDRFFHMEDQGRQEKRWANEAAFFDAETYSDAPIDALTVQRYCQTKKPWLYPEFPYWTMGDVRGKTILEVGCGDGTNSILMALRGARVVGIDISKKAIEAAKRKAERQGVSHLTEFVVSPFEVYETEKKFDWVVGMAILHHFLPVLEQVISQFRKFGSEKTKYLFSEPVALSDALRKFRLMLPIPIRGTPDERPLNKHDFKILDRSLPHPIHITYFGFLTRFSKFLISNGNYERTSSIRRLFYDLSARIDAFLLQRLRIGTLASCAVISAK